jgi:acyl carrier protein
MPSQYQAVASFLPRFAKVLGKVVGRDSVASEVTLQTRPAEKFGMDSLSAVTLMFLCEEEFGLDLAPFVAEISEIEVAGDFLAFLYEKGAR